MAETNATLASLMARPEATQNYVSIADAMRARQLAQAQIPLYQQETQEAQLKNQQMQAQLAANQKFGQLWASSGGDMAKLHTAMQDAAQDDPNFAQFVPQHIQELNQYQQSLYTLGDAEAKNLDTKNSIVLPSLDALRKASDPTERAAIRDKMVQTMKETPNLFAPEEIQAVQQMPLDDQTVAQNYSAHQSQTQLLAERKQAADDLKAHSEEMKDRYENVNGILYDKSVDPPKPVISGATMPATALRDAIDKIAPIDNVLTRDLNQAAQVQISTLLNQGNLNAANGAITELTKAVAARNEKTNPAVIHAEAQKAAQTEIERNRALAPDLKNLTQITTAGRKYVNAEDVKGASESLLRKQASESGIPVVDKDVASMLSDLDTARQNQQSMLDTVRGKLATNPGERIYKGPENKLEAAMQTDPTLAAMGTFRNAAIQSMRAVAGSKGLRINQAEVQLAIDNDIPKMTDTWDVAQSKLRMLQKFMDNAEQAHLTKNRSVGGSANTGELKPTHRYNPETQQIEEIKP